GGRRVERPAGEASQVPGAVRLAPPRPGGRTLPRGEGAISHGVPGSARLARRGRVPSRPPWRRTPARRRGGGARPLVRAGLDAKRGPRAGRTYGRSPGPHLMRDSMAQRKKQAVLFLFTGSYYRTRVAGVVLNSC